jgi:polo-like kinase 1
VLKTTLTKPKAKAKLQAEVKIHSALKHKYIVRFYHFFEDNDCYYMLLELAHNRSFSELMKKRKRLTEPEVQYFMLQIVEALKYMHGIGVIHRDLKLGNLLLDKVRLKLRSIFFFLFFFPSALFFFF